MTLTHDLERLAAAGRIRSAWLPGMAFHENATPGMGLYRDGWGRVTELWDAVPHAATPDLTDPATLGTIEHGILWPLGWWIERVLDLPSPSAPDFRIRYNVRHAADPIVSRLHEDLAAALTAAIHAAADGLGVKP